MPTWGTWARCLPLLRRADSCGKAWNPWSIDWHMPNLATSYFLCWRCQGPSAHFQHELTSPLPAVSISFHPENTKVWVYFQMLGAKRGKSPSEIAGEMHRVRSRADGDNFCCRKGCAQSQRSLGHRSESLGKMLGRKFSTNLDIFALLS